MLVNERGCSETAMSYGKVKMIEKPVIPQITSLAQLQFRLGMKVQRLHRRHKNWIRFDYLRLDSELLTELDR